MFDIRTVFNVVCARNLIWLENLDLVVRLPSAQNFKHFKFLLETQHLTPKFAKGSNANFSNSAVLLVHLHLNSCVEVT